MTLDVAVISSVCKTCWRQRSRVQLWDQWTPIQLGVLPSWWHLSLLGGICEEFPSHKVINDISLHNNKRVAWRKWRRAFGVLQDHWAFVGHPARTWLTDQMWEVDPYHNAQHGCKEWVWWSSSAWSWVVLHVPSCWAKSCITNFAAFIDMHRRIAVKVFIGNWSSSSLVDIQRIPLVWMFLCCSGHSYSFLRTFWILILIWIVVLTIFFQCLIFVN
jgi:hypothetical protein